MNFNESGEYIIVKKTEFKNYIKAYNDYELKKEYARNYSNKNYAKMKIEKQKLKEIQDEEEFLFHLEHTS